MKITKIFIEKFRGFQNVEFTLGSHLTVISGQNGTQKTTLLGLLSQPFSITDKKNPMYGESPLSGENFRSQFSDKFKLSKSFDKVGEHKWTLFFDDKSDYTTGSIDRGGKKKGEIRVWKVNKKTGKPDKSKGSGFVQLPVIYLSLKRLLPIGEDNKLSENKSIELTDDEKDFYKKWHNKILILGDEKINPTSLSSVDKQTLGANTPYYDWQSNSAGQDNIGKILLTILSFKRLKEKYENDYKGGILAIDEIDTTFYPGSQIKLLNALNKFASDFDIQIIFTTHSLTLLKEASKYQEDVHRKSQIKLAYLRKEDNKIIIENNIDYKFIEAHLNVSLTGATKIKKIDVFTEDPEGAVFAKSLLGTKRTKYLNFHTKVKLGCGNLIQLTSSKVPSFTFPNSIIILDGDIEQPNRINRFKNILLLPTQSSPEQIISNFLNNLSDSDNLWKEIDETFYKQYCFMDISNQEVQSNREKAKEWFNSHVRLWGRNASKVLNPWKKQNKELVDDFLSNFDDLFNKF
jgi:AAA15 family ATPase/GTPase